MIFPGLGILRAREIEKWPNRAVVGSQVKDRGSSGLSQRDALCLGLISGDVGERRGVGGFGACDACVDASLRVELERQLSNEGDQHIP
jgi:hypothetical protein